MNTKKDCWLCGKGYGLENGDLKPGELKVNIFGDLECIRCTSLLSNMVTVMEHPEITPLIKAIAPEGLILQKGE